MISARVADCSVPAPLLEERVAQVLPVLRADAGRVDVEASFPRRGLAALRESGLMGLLVPVEYGGLGGGLAELALVAGRLAGACLSTAMVWAMHCQQVAALAGHAAPPLRDDLLPRLAGGLYVASVTSEKGKGGHLLTANAPLLREGSLLRLRRDAPIVTGGADADGFLVTMRSDAAAPPTSVSLVYADRSALAVEPGGGSWNPMGMRGTQSIGLRLDGLVPPSNLVGGAGGFRDVAIRSFVPAGHVGWAACWLGAARGALSAVLEMVRSPEGRAQFDLSSELLLSRLATVRMDLDVAAAFLASVVREVEAARRSGDPEATPLQLRLNALKVLASERSFAVVDTLIQVVGLRHGYFRGARLPLERLFRDLRSASLNYGNDRLLLANGRLTLLDREVSLG
jgi:acyl-CoA dehydrogenase